LDQIDDIAGYLSTRPVLSKQLIDAAAESYFAKL
jgi:hypothetical protein